MSKRELERFRVHRFASPHPATLNAPVQQQSQAGGSAIQPDEGRVVIHFDVRKHIRQWPAQREANVLLHKSSRLIDLVNVPHRGISCSAPGLQLDAFYAQVEEVQDPSLRERPLGVTQKYLIVTSNYPARRRGVTKLMNIKEAKVKLRRVQS